MNWDAKRARRTRRIRGETLRVLHESLPDGVRMDDLLILLDRSAWTCSPEMLSRCAVYLYERGLLRVKCDGDPVRCLQGFARIAEEGGGDRPVLELTSDGILVAEGTLRDEGVEMGL